MDALSHSGQSGQDCTLMMTTKIACFGVRLHIRKRAEFQTKCALTLNALEASVVWNGIIRVALRLHATVMQQAQGLQ
eukprot:scaffold8089_cov16-Tisochrysis_lutea.AAC.1